MINSRVVMMMTFCRAMPVMMLFLVMPAMIHCMVA